MNDKRLDKKQHAIAGLGIALGAENGRGRAGLAERRGDGRRRRGWRGAWGMVGGAMNRSDNIRLPLRERIKSG